MTGFIIVFIVFFHCLVTIGDCSFLPKFDSSTTQNMNGVGVKSLKEFFDFKQLDEYLIEENKSRYFVDRKSFRDSPKSKR